VFKSFKHKRFLKEANYLALRPVAHHRHETNEEGNLFVIVPKFKNKWLIKFLVPPGKSPHFRIKLDEQGSAVWKCIDGKRNVEEICKMVTQQLGEKIQPAEERVTKFLSLLYKQGFITFAELTGLDETRY
jgi:hypothetical protein